MKALRLVIAGRVQGVGYRDWMVAEAAVLGVSGWVRNRVDGRVEALVAGEAEAVDRLVEVCRRGPRLAAVGDIATEAAGPPATPGFHRLPTA
jgi:acylphosphatase